MLVLSRHSFLECVVVERGGWLVRGGLSTLLGSGTSTFRMPEGMWGKFLDDARFDCHLLVVVGCGGCLLFENCIVDASIFK